MVPPVVSSVPFSKATSRRAAAKLGDGRYGTKRIRRDVRYLPLSEAKRTTASERQAIDIYGCTTLVPFEGNERAHRHVELAQPGGAAEVGQIDDEAGGEHLRAQLA